MNPKKLTIREIPEDDRPREKLTRLGEQSLNDSELLAILLGAGTHGENVVQLAQRILSEAGDLTTLSSMSVRELCNKFRGIGPARAAQLKAALELARRHVAQASRKRTHFSHSQKVFEYFRERFRGSQQEEFWTTSLDAKNKLLKESQITKGTLMGSLVHPREVFHHAIRDSAAGIIILHNHPSGDPQPSAEDRKVTAQIAEAGKVLGIPLLDHIIIGNDSYYSFKDAGLI